MSIELHDETDRLSREQLRYIVANTQAAATALGCVGEVRVRVVADEKMAREHEEFTGVPGTTDVLTFDMTDPEEVDPPLPREVEKLGSYKGSILYGLDTDILICVDEAGRQAAKRGYPVEKELLLYVLHGVLHCLGMDDHEEASFEAMHRMEDAVLSHIGVGPVFHTP